MLRKLWALLTALALLIGQTALALPPAIQTVATANKQDVATIVAFGQSQIAGARNVSTELPSGYCTTADSKAFIWDFATTKKVRNLVFGPMEQQPDPALIDITYTDTIGPLCEFFKWLRASGDTSEHVVFNLQLGGGRFSDAGSNGRAVNYTVTLSDGAWATFQRQWRLFQSALALQGKRSKVVLSRTDLGYGSSLDGTEATNYESDMGKLITATRATITGQAPLLIERVTDQATGLANRATVRTGQQNLAPAASLNRLVNTDGMPVEGVDTLHFTAPAHMAIGNAMLDEYKGYWYPQKEWSYLGGCPVKREWRAGDLRNTYTTTISTLWDASGGGGSLTQATGSLQPTLVTTALSNGYTARYATGDGTDDVMTNTAPFAVGDAGSFAILAAVSAPGTANTVLWGEGGAGVNPFYSMRATGTGSVEFITRTDAGVVSGPTSLQTGAFDSTMNFVALVDTGSAVRAQVNGSLGSDNAYTRGTLTTDRSGLWALNYGSGIIQYMNAKIGIVWATDGCIPDNTYLANARAFTDREYGTQ